MASPKSDRLFVSQAQQGFLVARGAEGRSPKTIKDYAYCLGMLARWRSAGGATLASLTREDLRRFLAELRDRSLSPKTIRNVYLALSSFYAWASRELDVPNPMGAIAVPKAHAPALKLPTQEEISRLLRACDYTEEASPPRRGPYRMRRATALRDRAILMTLVDTGLRAQELCGLAIADLDLKTGAILVRKGKGSKQRVAYCGKATRRVLWRYLTAHRKEAGSSDPLFVTRDGRAPLTVDRLSHLVNKLGRKAGIDVWPHLLRHVFATEFLRGGGNLLALQRLLGHASMSLLQRYAEIAQADLQAQHAAASPADRWRL